MPEIQKVSVKHNEIMDFMMANPNVKLGDVATHFGVTQPWLSCIIHSDAFQALLREKQGIAFHHTVLTVREKMVNVAHMALDRIAEQIPKETELPHLNKVAENVLDRLGFGTKPQGGLTINAPGGNVQVNTLREELEEARRLLGQAPRPNLEVVIDGNRTGVALPASSAPAMGSNSEREELALLTGEIE